MAQRYRNRWLALGLGCLLPLAAADVSRAASVFFADFEDGNLPTEFTGTGSVVSSEGYGDENLGFGEQFLRNDSGGRPAPASVLTLNNLPTHTHLDLGFLLATIDSWDGESISNGPDLFNVEVDDTSIFSEPFDTFRDTEPDLVLRDNGDGNVGFNGQWNDSAYDFTSTSDPATMFQQIPHTADSVTIEFFSSGAGWQGGSDESFAIDNVSVEVTGIPSPLAGSAGLLLCSLLALRRSNRQTGVRTDTP